MPKVLISDPLAPEGLEILERARGIEVDQRAGSRSREELLEAIRDAEGLVIRSGTKVTAEVLEAAEKLKVIGRAGIGVDNVDVAAASKRGVVVVNTPGGNTVTTAEHAIALLVSLARHIPQATASMKAGKWEKKKFKGMELYNRTLGVVGLGNVGRIVADRARGLGMQVIAFDPYISAEVAQKHDVELLELRRAAGALRRHHRPRSPQQGDPGAAGAGGLREGAPRRPAGERGAGRHRRRGGPGRGARVRPGGRRGPRRVRGGAAARGPSAARHGRT